MDWDNLIAAMAALISVISYVCYVFFYKETQMERVEGERIWQTNLAHATILYGLASMVLILLIALSSLCFGLQPPIALWKDYTTQNTLLIPMVLMMIVGYAIHIAAEAHAVRNYETSIYANFFQLYLVIIAALGFIINHDIFSKNKIVSGLMLVCVSVYCSTLTKRNIEISRRIAYSNIIIAVVSALFCGVSLFIDADIVEKTIGIGTHKKNRVTVYLVYEWVTFFFPFLIVLIGHIIISKGFKKAILDLKKRIKSTGKTFLVASFFSVFQFIFSVFALAFANDKSIPIGIFALTGFFSFFITSTLYQKVGQFLKLKQTQTSTNNLSLTIKIILSILVFGGIFLIKN
ncbi:MAG: hypothetical protein RLZZ292_3364 [Bacteroidota bacterium]|jgi:hypothetical protein